MEISQDQHLAEGDYTDVQWQSLYDDHVLDLCCRTALNVWDRFGEIAKKIEPFTKVVQGPKDTFKNFLQILTSAVNRMKSN